MKSNILLWNCKNCDQDFIQLTGLLQHMKYSCVSASANVRADDQGVPLDLNDAEDQNVWSCIKCPQVFSSAEILSGHLMNHSSNKKVNRTKINIQNKIRTVSEKESGKLSWRFDKLQNIYTCLTCLAEFSDKNELLVHMDNHPEFTCETCNESFKSILMLGFHSSEHSTDNAIKCPLCTYKCEKKNGLVSHMHWNHAKNNFTCAVCVESLRSPIQLFLHQRNQHKDDKTILKVVQMSFIKQHKKTFLCDTCGKEFSLKYRLERHIKALHEGLKPHVCQFCKRSFTGKDTMKKHERIHTGEKPYSCEFCGKCFRQDGPFKVHLRTHTGVRPYICQFCKKGFITNQCLKHHRNNCSLKALGNL